MTDSTALPAGHEAAYRRFLRIVDDHERYGYKVPCRGPGADQWLADTARAQRAAAEQCGWCPARAACLAYATEHREPAGVWGGTTAKQRKTERQQEAA